MFRTPPVTIHESQSYAVTSFGNGAAYSFENKATKRSVFFQDDAADQFRDELRAEYEGFPDRELEDTLDVLWNDYEYVLASQPDEDD